MRTFHQYNQFVFFGWLSGGFHGSLEEFYPGWYGVHAPAFDLCCAFEAAPRFPPPISWQTLIYSEIHNYPILHPL